MSLVKLWIKSFEFYYREFSRTPPLKWYENRFTITCSRLCIIHTWFEVRCVPTILENVLHNQNVSVRHMKNFLQASKVKFFAQNPPILSMNLCQASEYFVMLFGFLAKTLTSDVCRKLLACLARIRSEYIKHSPTNIRKCSAL